jgi:hypothetical protein
LTFFAITVNILLGLTIKHSDKKEIISRLLNVPNNNKRFFWAREIKFLNDFLKKYNNADFWLKINFSQKYDSLVFLKGEYGEKVLRKKFSEFNYVIKTKDDIPLGNKYGENRPHKKQNKTIKNFLEDE